jgi:two-component system, cell cycle sensor histidine kinase and response regulator CckA
MKTPIRVLIVEDSQFDNSELLVAELTRHDYDVTYTRVHTEADMEQALADGAWDVVLSDYGIPAFSGTRALETLKRLGRDVPFIIVSGTMGEELAVAALKAGAHDYISKAQLARLSPAVARALRDVVQQRERLRLEEQLRQAQKLEGIGRLAGGIAHDFNNILTTIAGYSEMVLDQIGPDKPISGDLIEIRKATDRAAQLTRQLLAFSRQQVLRVADIDVNEVVWAMRGMLQRLIGEDIVVEIKLTDALPSIRADRIQLEQVLMNVAANARDAMPQGGHFTIETGLGTGDDIVSLTRLRAAPGTYVKLTMTDTGVGMDERTQQHLFEPFFTTKELGKGTGLGLATVYGIVKQLDGFIWVTSALQRGSTFTLFFPALEAVAKPVPAATGQKVPLPLATERETVLVVEDEAGVRHLVTRTLGRHGYRVLEAGSAAEGLQLVAKYGSEIDVVLTDVVMAVMNGPQMVAKIRESMPTMKVLFMSGHAGQAIKEGGKLEASDHLLEKPFYAHDLLKAVRDLLDE